MGFVEKSHCMILANHGDVSVARPSHPALISQKTSQATPTMNTSTNTMRCLGVSVRPSQTTPKIAKPKLTRINSTRTHYPESRTLA